MAETQKMPDWIMEALARHAPEGEVRLALATDLASDGSFGERWVALAGERLLVLSPNGGEPEVQVDLHISKVSEIAIDNLVGGGMLQAVLEGGCKIDLLPYTSARTIPFARFRTQLEAMVQDKPVPQLADEVHRCATCGLMLGELTRVCPRCLRRGTTMRRLLGYARPYGWRLVVTALLMLLSTALMMVPSALTRPLLDRVLIPHNPALLPWLVLCLVLSAVLSNGFAVLRGRLTAWLGARVSFDIRAQLYDRLQWLSLRYYDRHPTGAIISRLTQDTNGVQEFLAFGLPFLVGNILQIVAVAIGSMYMNWRLALIALVPIPLICLLTRALWTRMRRAHHAFWFRWGRYYALVSDALNRVRIIKAFSQQTAEINRYSTRNTEVMKAAMQADQLWASIFPVVTLLLSLGTYAVWYFGGWQVIKDPQMTPGTLMGLTAYLGFLWGPVNFLTQLMQWMTRALTASERIFEVLDAESDREGSQGDVVPETMRGEIEFRNVTFGYKGDQPVLKDVSFKAEPGKMLGLVGKSGAGKSTIINLICRFYEIDQGEILVDGVKLSDLSLWAYRGKLGAVLQEPFLFAGTVSDNIAYGKPEASREEIMAAAKIANAHGFIVNRPDGYDSQVGERGGNLSGGEKQRICIARAILHDPAILILDEATANVDLETEELIQEALARLTAGRTTIAIAHRLSTLRNADHLLVIQDGKVAEYGTHQELEENKSVYYELLQMHRKTSMVEALHD